MSVFLQAVSGESSGRTIHLRHGEYAQVGRTNSADISFPNDSEMFAVHFAMECGTTNCRVRSLTGGPGILVNGSPASEAILKSGDQLTAGNTTFAVFLGDRPPTDFHIPPQEDMPDDSASRPSPLELCIYLDLDEATHPIARQIHNNDELLPALVEKELLPAALRLQAHLLTTKQSIRWAVACVRPLDDETLAAEQQRALESADAWLAQPSEETRRDAETAAASSGLQEPAGWVAQGGIWSGGSIAPPGRDVVAPDERLAGQAATTALLLAAVQRNPTDVSGEYREFLKNATAMNEADNAN